MPGYIAWVYVYGMAVQLVQADGFFNRWNEEEFRKTYFDKVVSGYDPVMQDIAIEPEPSLVQTLDESEPVVDSEEGQLDEPKVAAMKPKVGTSGRTPSRA